MNRMRRDETVIDLVQFRLAGGMNEETFLKLSDAAQTAFFEKADGHLGRELTKIKDGSWVDIIRWETAEKADKAPEEFSKNTDCLNLIHACDISSMKIVRLERVKLYG